MVTESDLEKKMPSIVERLREEMNHFAPLTGDCGNFATALARSLGTTYYACSYWSEGALSEGEPDHCATLWCPELPEDEYEEKCDTLWDATGRITFDKLKKYAEKQMKEHADILDEEFDWEPLVEIWDDADDPYGFTAIYNEKKIETMTNLISDIRNGLSY